MGLSGYNTGGPAKTAGQGDLGARDGSPSASYALRAKQPARAAAGPVTGLLLLTLLAGCCLGGRRGPCHAAPRQPPRATCAQPEITLTEATLRQELVRARQEAAVVSQRLREVIVSRDQLHEANVRLLNELARRREELAEAQAQATPAAAPAPPVSASTPWRPNTSIGAPSLWQRLFDRLGPLAIGVATGSPAAAAVGWWIGRRLLQRAQARIERQVIAIDTPPPPQQVVPETRFYPIEKDTFAQAYTWAKVETVRKFPGAEGAFHVLDDLIQQFLSARVKGAKP